MDLSLLRDDILLNRFKTLSDDYAKFAIELEDYLKKFHNIRLELALVEEEVKKRKLER